MTVGDREPSPVDLAPVIAGAGLEGRTASIVGAVRWSHRMVLTERGVEIGRSRVGDLPDLPQGVDWPTVGGEGADDELPLTFVAQVALAETAPWAWAGPADGLLLVFADWTPGAPEDVGTVRVLHVREERARLRPRPWPAVLPAERRIVCEGTLDLVPERVLPPALPDVGDARSPDPDAERDYADVREALAALERERDPRLADVERPDAPSLGGERLGGWAPTSAAAVEGPRADGAAAEVLLALAGHTDELLMGLEESPNGSVTVELPLGADPPAAAPERAPSDVGEEAALAAREGIAEPTSGFALADGHPLLLVVPRDDLRAGRFDRVRPDR